MLKLLIWAVMKVVCFVYIILLLDIIYFNIICILLTFLARAVWKDYLNELTAIVFIVDASNRDRIEESRGELEKLLSDPRLKTTPFLILGNKIDLAGAMSETDLKQNLGITLSTTGKSQPVPKGGRPMEVFMCSLIRNRGYKEGIQWLSQFF